MLIIIKLLTLSDHTIPPNSSLALTNTAISSNVQVIFLVISLALSWPELADSPTDIRVHSST